MIKLLEKATQKYGQEKGSEKHEFPGSLYLPSK